MAALLGVTDYCGPIESASLSRNVQPRLFKRQRIPPRFRSFDLIYNLKQHRIVLDLKSYRSESVVSPSGC
jgi:hypothetical protein